MHKNTDYFSGGKPCNDPQMHKIKALQGQAKPQPDQGTRTSESGSDGEVTLSGRGTMEEKA